MTVLTMVAQVATPEEFDRDQAIVLAIGAGAAAAVWAVVFAVLVVATRVREVAPQPAGLELGGDHAPAVVSVLTNEWEFDRSAAGATVIDLAARGHLEITRVGLDEHVVGLRAAPGGPPLTAYEQRIVELVRRLGGGRPLPLVALVVPGDAAGDRWFGGFEGEVRDEMRAAGLSRRRWSPWMVALLFLLAIPSGVLLGWITTLIPDNPQSTEDDNPAVLVAFVAVTVVVVLMGIFGRVRGERDTPAGRAAAARWLGLRENVAASGSFEDVPPTAIAVWERHLAYGTAFGLARTVLAELQLAPESATEAWSHASGQWRLVKIDYGRLFAIRGRAPWKALFQGLLVLGGGLTMLRAFGALLVSVIDSIGPDDSLGTRVGFHAFAVFTVLLATALVVWGTIATVGGAMDLGRGVERTGVVLRLRGTFVAVDDGTGHRVRALPSTKPLTGLREGGRATIRYSRRLGYVRSVMPVDDEAAPTG